MNRQEANNNAKLRSEYHGYDKNNIITKAVLGSQYTNYGRSTSRVMSAVSIKPPRKRKGGAQ